MSKRTLRCVDTVNNWNLGGAFYDTIQRMSANSTISWLIAALTTFLLATWFITSSDSGTLVITTILSMGNPHPPKRHRLIWGVTQGVVAGTLLVVGGLAALQTAAIAPALPISALVVLMSWGSVKSLMQEPSAVPDRHETVASDGTALDRDLRA